jgi:hypothetical protein
MQKGEQIVNNASALVQEAPALKRPCFPKPKAAPGPSSAVGSGWARGFLLRRLNASALAGDSETFSNDIQRLENLGEKEASTLLHKARCGWLWLWRLLEVILEFARLQTHMCVAGAYLCMFSKSLEGLNSHRWTGLAISIQHIRVLED